MALALGIQLLPPVPTAWLAPMALALVLHLLPLVFSVGWVPTQECQVHLWWEPAPTAGLVPMALAPGLHQLPLVFPVGWATTLQPWELNPSPPVSTVLLVPTALALATPQLPPALSVSLVNTPLPLGLWLLLLAPTAGLARTLKLLVQHWQPRVSCANLALIQQLLEPSCQISAISVILAPTQQSLGL